MFFSRIPSSVKRILVTTKYRYIGDTLLSLPAIRSMHNRWPNAQITLLTGRSAAELMRGCPYLSDIIPFVPDSPENRGIEQYRNLVKILRPRRYDLAFIYHTSFHSALTPFLSGIKFRVGWRGFEGRDFLFSRSYQYVEDRSEIDVDLDLVHHVAPDAASERSLSLWLTDEERANVPDEIRNGGRMVGLQPGATNDRKRWPAAQYAELTRILLGNGVDKIVLIGGPDECEAAEDYFAKLDPNLRQRCVNLVGKLQLRATRGVLTHLQLFVANDTAIRHCSVALDIPSIGLFGTTNVVKWGNPVPPKHLVLVSQTGSMDGISTQEVVQTAQKLLGAATVGVG